MNNNTESDSGHRVSEEEDAKSQCSNDDDDLKAKKAIKEEENEIGDKEAHGVFRAKMMVYVVLVYACVTTCVLTSAFTKSKEEDTFEEDFRRYADHVSTSAANNMASVHNVAQSLGIALTSYVTDSGESFPYVTLPNFELRMRKARSMTGAEMIAWIPFFQNSSSEEWEEYAQNHSGWIREGLDLRGLRNVDPGPVPQFIHRLLQTEYVETDHYYSNLEGYVAPLWQSSQAPINASIINSDLLVDTSFLEVADLVVSGRKGLFSSKIDISKMASYYNLTKPESTTASSPVNGEAFEESRVVDPNRYIYSLDPVFEFMDNEGDVVGFHYLVVPWEVFFQGALPVDSGRMDVVVSDRCGRLFSLFVDGNTARYVGEGDFHNPKYEDFKVTRFLSDVLHDFDTNKTNCEFVLKIYPTDDMNENYESGKPLVFSLVVAGIFVFTTMVFLCYDWAVQRRQWMIIRAARKTQAILSSLFPKNVQDRIMKDVDEEENRETKKYLMMRGSRAKDQLQNFLKGKGGQDDEEECHDDHRKSKPIADLFPEATIIFADIVGFTAWSSTREPSQVFQLLETVYHVFDEIANRRRVFKIETVGDCYVAVAGLPEPRRDHAVVMARFARDSLAQFSACVKALVVELGPDTEELSLRIGLHSGPVTAGVLRGKRGRFQLFGDTVNTAARMESTGHPNKIHVSQETADFLKAAGKSQWLRMRGEKVVAKGKGELQTYWLEDVSGGAGTPQQFGESDQTVEEAESKNQLAVPEIVPAAPVSSADKYDRLVAWNCDILARSLTHIVAHRESLQADTDSVSEIKKLEEQYSSNRYVLGEVQEIVRLPKYEADSHKVDPSSVKLSSIVLSQLKEYVQTLASMYRDNPFHNFEHASHVTMSVMKLLSRIVAPDLSSSPTATEETLHDHTYGITSDPMTQFAVVLSALIHDVNHPGVPNSQLIKEQTSLAAVYRYKSIAEQNSVDLAWDVLMDNARSDLRQTIYVSKAEFLRFRQLVVNIVLATDIMDKDLAALRKARWNKAFSGGSSGSTNDDVNRKATIVMEHLIQASDVAHTMQHWHIYRKWNQRLLKEMYQAFLKGRAEVNPFEGWYKGELGFFDFYIIPLAKKLQDCGVFGVSSDEYLQYAIQNRKEWEMKGEFLVAQMLQDFKEQGLVP